MPLCLACQLDMQVSLPPSYSSKVKQGVHEILNDHLMKYAPAVSCCGMTGPVLTCCRASSLAGTTTTWEGCCARTHMSESPAPGWSWVPSRSSISLWLSRCVASGCFAPPCGRLDLLTTASCDDQGLVFRPQRGQRLVGVVNKVPLRWCRGLCSGFS